MKIDTMKLKELNIELVKTELKNMKSGTKNSLAFSTGLSVATCGNILSELLGTEEVIELENADSTGGRRSKQFKYNSDYAHIAVLYARIEGSSKSIYSAVYNMTGDKLYEKSQNFEEITISELDSSLFNLIWRYEKIKAISIGIPGVVHRGVIGLCDLKELENVPVEEFFYKKFNRTVVAENDVNSAVLGYYNNAGSNYQHESIVYIYSPEYGNPGAGILINGQILRGKSDFAGEISFLPGPEGRNDQDEIQRDSYNFSEYIVNIIMSLNAVLDPEAVVLTGRRFSSGIRKNILHNAAEFIPADHLPVISFEEDLHESFINGLITLAYNNMGCGFMLVKK